VLSRIEMGLLLITSFLPAIIYTIWFRNTEKYNRQRWGSIAVAFIWGASIAIIAALILEIILDIGVAITFSESTNLEMIAVIMIAPFAEELVKPLALRTRSIRKELNEIEDGLIYGAVAGLGFSATENLFYGLSFFSEGLVYFLILMAIRSVGGCLLHASATALTGYGYSKTILNHSSKLRIIPYLVLAMFVHGLYNFLVSWEGIGIITGLIAALLVVFLSMRYVRNKIKVLDNR
jgi:RsiW-degrading membrane proteinase PrsW (M82 family)